MKKILITGCTATQVGNIAKIATLSTLLSVFLRECGYKVEWRPVVPGESLDKFDKVIVWIIAITGLGSRWWGGAMWTLSQRPDAIIGLDDWKTAEIMNSFRAFNRNFQKRAFQSLDNRENVDEAKKYADVLQPVTDCLATERWPFSVLCPVFPWGDPRLLRLPVDNYLPVDPSALVPRYDISISATRQRRWVLASIGKHGQWLERKHLSWPVLYVGHRMAKKRIPEEDVLRCYSRCWGVLSPKYYHAGSGWWRARYNFAAQMGAVLYADPEETSKMGDAYSISTTDVEFNSERELQELAVAQADWLGKHTWSRDKLATVMKRILA